MNQQNTRRLVRVLSDKPSNAYRRQCNAWLVTDCYLANRRLLPFTARYEMIHMVSDPPALYFPKIFLFDAPKRSSIIVKRNNGQNVECAVHIPEKLAQSGFLKIGDDKAKNRTNEYEFILDPRAVTAAGRFTENLHLKAKKSEMTLPIAFAANVIDSRADIQIGDSNQHSHQLDGIPVVITNVGETEMRVYEARFKTGNLYYTPHLPPNLILSVGESLNLLVKVRKRLRFFHSPTVKDTLIIRLSDSQFPQGLFKKEIVAEVRGIF